MIAHLVRAATFLALLSIGFVALARQATVEADSARCESLPDTVAVEANTNPTDGGEIGVSGPSTGRLVTVGVTLAAANTGIFFLERDRWWGNPDARFHFQTDTDYARNFDKLGHLYGTHFYAMMIAGSFRWAGVRPERAAMLGSILALAIQTHVEINDGFYRTWGFDWLDQAANVAGATWFYVRSRVDWAANFDLRWSYWPNEIRKPADSLTDEMISAISDNYNGQSYWVAARMHRLLPDHLKPYWPRQLLLSTGVFLDGWATKSMARDLGLEPRPGEVSTFISLDVDFQELGVRNFLGDVLNLVHLPAPAIRLWPEPRVFLLFWGQGR
jgi:hypothetical protein